MHISRFHFFTAACLLMLAGLLAVGCSDEDKSVAPTPQWRWAPVLTESSCWGAALAVYDNRLIIAQNGVCAWDGSSWATLMSNTNGSIFALAVYDNKLIAAGNFTIIYTDNGDINSNRIASWDGTSWTPLGTGMTGMDNDILSLTVWNNKLIACGNFTSAGGVSANYIAAWDGSSWDSLGAGFNGTVSGLTVYNDQLIAGAGNQIAVWDGSSWLPIPNSPDISQSGGTSALIVYYDMLIRSGNFTYANVEQMYIGAWDGSSWTTLGTGTDNWIYGLAVFDNKVIATGTFINAGGVNVNYIAAWDGASWTPLGTGLNDIGFAVTVWNNQLIAAGNFSSAGGVEVLGVASWAFR